MNQLSLKNRKYENDISYILLRFSVNIYINICNAYKRGLGWSQQLEKKHQLINCLN
jgi:hypothetical protein